MREDHTEVLVVGAGPVGLLSALLLSEAGIQVKVIDRESRTTTGSYPCALHARTLQVLDRLGLVDGLIERGRRVEKVQFYEGPELKGEVKLSAAGGTRPFVLIVSQNEFEEVLEHRLGQKGVPVNWNHRFDDFQGERDTVSVSIDKLGGTSTGYIVPHWETVVQKRFSVRARFIIGADGHNSVVRDRLGIDYTQVRGAEYFVDYEFEADTPAGEEMKVVLDGTTTNVLWPLPGNKQRWIFQMVKSEMSHEFPEKERRSVRFEHKSLDESLKAQVQKLVSRRAPWFKASVLEVTRSTDVFFEQRLAKQFGKGGCWLAGDSAHQTGPVGAQSMNIGMLEAESLASRLIEVIRGRASFASLEAYNMDRQQEWEPLLALRGGLKARESSSPWVKERLERVLPCLPASGESLSVLADQLGCDFQRV